MSRLPVNYQFKITKIGSSFDFNWDDGFATTGETHISWEIVHVVSGCVQVTEDTRLYELREGDMVIHAPMEFHAIKSAHNTSPHVYIIAVVTEGELPHNLTEGVFRLSEEERGEYSALFKRFFDFFHRNRNDNLAGQECADSLSSFLIRMSWNHKAENKVMLSGSAMEYNKIVKVMEEHVCDNYSLAEIGKLTNISVSNMKVLFRKYCGISPKMYYCRLRCTEAIRLMSGGLSATETADRMSFSSPNYFNTFFKRITGSTPMAFIRKAQDKK